MNEAALPAYGDMLYPTLEALDALGGEAKIAELEKKVIELMSITSDQLAVEFPEGSSKAGSKIRDRLGWARSYLNKLEAADSLGRGVWQLTPDGRRFLELDDGEAELRHREHELRVGKSPDLFLKQATESASQGSPMTLSVRSLLREWGVTRRGSAVVTRVSRDLKGAGLATQPAFDRVGLDTEVSLVAPPEASQPPDAGGEAAPDPVRTQTVTIGTLSSAGSGVTAVASDDTVLRAQSLMASNDYSQLAVMGGSRSLKGAISWESIAQATLYRDRAPRVVGDAMVKDPVVVYDDDALFDHTAAIAAAGYVFVRDRAELVTGIVTTADLADQFSSMANPFLLIGEIEGWLRILVDEAFTGDELVDFADPNDTDREVGDASSLTFGEYQRLFENPDAWERLDLQADRRTFRDHLEEVRRVRNSIMHFSPDPLNPEDLRAIKTLLDWVRTLAASP